MSRKTAAILLSRQSLGACGTTHWVQAAMRAIGWVKSEGLTLITSVGMQTWELLCVAASLEDIPQIVIVPAGDHDEYVAFEPDLRRDFSIPDSCVCRPVYAPDRRERQARRDKAVIDLADVLIPVSLRNNGSLHTQVEAARSSRTVCEQFRVAYESQSTPLKYEIPTLDLNPDLCSLSSNRLIHWTRGRFSPWPDERPLDYYRNLIHSGRPNHTALDTLRHIIDSRRLIAGERHMPRGVRTVSLSGLSADRIVPLMRWRARYCEMSFEPYGVGIDPRRAFELGIRPVKYFDPAQGEHPDRDNSWLAQSVGKRSDWTQEMEYRHPGDLDLSKLPDESMILFCMTPSEAADLATSTGLRSVPLLAHELQPGRSASRHTTRQRIRAASE